MSIKDFFTVPENEKISDRAFTRVLISTICGILLCMICLAGTTWAWFISNVEGPGSVMSIASISVDATLLQGEDEILALLKKRCENLPELSVGEILTGMLHNRLGRMIVKYAGLDQNALCGKLRHSELEKLTNVY